MNLRSAPFLFVPLAAALLFASAALADEPYSLKRMSGEEKGVPKEQAEADAMALPEEVPEAFKSAVRPDGLRLAAKDGSPIYDLWPCRKVKPAAVRSQELSVNFGQLEVGTFMGILRSHGAEFDYYENPIEKGVYVLRYGVQPDNGDHMGTAESRDFLLLTRFEQDQKSERVKKMEDLIEMAMAATASGHPMILFLEKPPDLAADSPRLYRHERRDEWLVDLEFESQAAEKEPASKLRLGVVLIGVSEHF